MRAVHSMLAVLPLLVVGAPAYGQLGLYGAPSTLPLQPAQPIYPTTSTQYPPLYVEAASPNPQAVSAPQAAGPAAVAPAPHYGNPGYVQPAAALPSFPGAARAYPQTQHNPQSAYGHDPGYGMSAGPVPIVQAGKSSKNTSQPAPRLPQPPQPLVQPGRAPLGPNTPGTISQMLDGNDGSLAGCGGCGDPGTCSTLSCDTTCGSCCPTWFGSVAGLYMSRNQPNRLWTTYETDNNPNQLTTDAIPSWKAGGEVTIGRLFCCRMADACVDPCAPSSCDPCGSPCAAAGRSFGIEATYWGLDTFEGYSSRSITDGSVSTPLIVDEIEFTASHILGTVYFDSAEEHRVWRSNEIHNLEVNLFGSPTMGDYAFGGGGAGTAYSSSLGYNTGPLAVGWVLGVRYFRFEENFLLGSLDYDATWGQAGGADEAYLEDNVRNSLLGCQVGLDFTYHLPSRWRIFAAPKLGIYNNHAENFFEIRRGDGVVATPTAGSQVTGTYPVRSSEDVVAFLSEIDLGLDWRIAPHWSVYLGYRVVVVSGIALADDQIPTYVVDIPEIADIDTNNNLVLHGAFAGVSVNF